MKSNQERKGTFVTLELDAESNKILTESARVSVRNKRREAQIRLQDHLRRFQSISELGNTVGREKV